MEVGPAGTPGVGAVGSGESVILRTGLLPASPPGEAPGEPVLRGRGEEAGAEEDIN